MPNLNVCTGRAFGVGALGELEPANVRNVAWPYSSIPATASAQMLAANGLRYDQTTLVPGGGLWVAQVGPNTSTSRQTGAPASSVAVGSTPEAGAGLTALSFVNPSSVQTMAVLTTLTWSASIAFGLSTWMELWAGASISPGTANVPWGAADSNPAGTGSFVWTANASDSMAFTVPPASTVALTARLGVKNVAGTGVMTWNSWRFSASSVFALIDPTVQG